MVLQILTLLSCRCQGEMYFAIGGVKVVRHDSGYAGVVLLKEMPFTIEVDQIVQTLRSGCVVCDFCSLMLP